MIDIIKLYNQFLLYTFFIEKKTYVGIINKNNNIRYVFFKVSVICFVQVMKSGNCKGISPIVITGNIAMSWYKISIKNLAKLINKTTNNNKKIIFSNKKKNKTVYVTSNLKIRKSLNVKQKIKLNEGIIKTYNNIINNKKIYF